MTTTILLDPATWDLVVDANGNIAVGTNPYQVAQDAATAIVTFKGDLRYNTTDGVPYFDKILGKNPSISVIKAELVKAAKSATGVVDAVVYISSISGRTISGQVQVTDENGVISTASF